MRSPTVGNPFRTRLRFGGQTDRRRGMLVALVQSVVSAFDEYFSPLDEAGRHETSHHANDDFLNKRRVHWLSLESRSGAMAQGDAGLEGRFLLRLTLCSHGNDEST